MFVKNRLEDTSALLEKIKKDMEEYTKIYEDTKAKYEAYKHEEIEKTENDIKNMKIE
jgi:3-methyladenine DNA glycosylase AlkC